MTVLRFNCDCNSEKFPGLAEIAAERPEHFGSDGIALRFIADTAVQGLSIRPVGDAVEVRYASTRDAYRAVGILLGNGAGQEIAPVTESTPFTSLGVMIDVSRNAVLRPDAVKYFLRRCALMGINSVQLYMEDVYQLDGEPFFGYARGGYSAADLREMDAYAALFEIELIPCVQTLGHLEQILQWPAYAELVDTPSVLMIGEERSYELIGKMLQTLAQCFRSRRIHIGMDEAHGIGLGRYRRLKGERRIFDILNEHLAVVTGMCTDLGLKPMMWSDMYFRIGSRNNDYHDLEAVIPADVPARIPQSVDLVYWDYYHNDPAFYEAMIDRHLQMGKTPAFAPGAVNWGRMWTAYTAGFAFTGAGMVAARKRRLKEAFITLWGDDGAEYNPFSVLPSLQHFAECAYGYAVDDIAHLESRFPGSCGVALQPYLLGATLDAFPDGSEPQAVSNFSKWLLWHDPVLSFLAPCIPAGMAGHYRQLAAQLEGLNAGGKDANIRFAALLARLLAGKVRLHLEVRPAYHAKDTQTLAALKDEVLPQVIVDCEALWELHRQIWHDWYRPFGWEVIDRRYGGIIARLQSLGRILGRCVQEPQAPVPQFEYALQKVEPGTFFTFARTSFPTTWR